MECFSSPQAELSSLLPFSLFCCAFSSFLPFALFTTALLFSSLLFCCRPSLLSSLLSFLPFCTRHLAVSYVGPEKDPRHPTAKHSTVRRPDEPGPPQRNSRDPPGSPGAVLAASCRPEAARDAPFSAALGNSGARGARRAGTGAPGGASRQVSARGTFAGRVVRWRGLCWAAWARGGTPVLVRFGSDSGFLHSHPGSHSSLKCVCPLPSPGAPGH